MTGFGDGDDAGDGQGDGSSAPVFHGDVLGYGYGDGHDHRIKFREHGGDGRGWGNGFGPCHLLRTTRSFDGHLINLYLLGLLP